MSYDIWLKDRVTGEELYTDNPHFLTGGTYAIGGTTEMWLNITYNYSNYYYEATDGDSRFDHHSRYPEDERFHNNYGIRGIYGKSGAESIPMLKDMIARIEEKYKKDGEWIVTVREREKFVDPDGNEYSDYIEAILKDKPRRRERYTIEVNEGPNEDYWEPTAGNAIKPLWKLIALAEMRPDGVWDGD